MRTMGMGLSALIDGLGNFIGWLLIAPFAAAAEAIRRVFRRLNGHAERLADVEDHLELDEDKPRLDKHDERIEQLEDMSEHQHRALYGDPDDPQDQGMRGEVHDLHQEMHNRHDDE